MDEYIPHITTINFWNANFHAVERYSELKRPKDHSNLCTVYGVESWRADVEKKVIRAKVD